MSETETSKDSWDGLLTNFLKAEYLKYQQETFVCSEVNVEAKDMALVLERKKEGSEDGNEKFIFSLNVTNKVFLKENGMDTPKEAIGKRITLKKVLATNPNTKKEVDSLRICKIE